MFFLWLLLILIGIRLVYSFTSQFAILRVLMMLAACLVITIYGFTFAGVEYKIFTLAWWQTEGIIWAAASVFFCYVVADFAWEPHYYNEYTFVEHFFGAPEVSIREVEEYHPIRWILVSVFLGAGTTALGTFLQDMIVRKPGYLIHGFIGLACFLVYAILLIRKIVKSVRGY